MSDTTDYDMHAEIAALSVAHDRLRELAAALTRGGANSTADEASIDATLEELGSVLAYHTRREEVGLFAALRRVAVGDDYVDRFKHDHSDIEEALELAERDHAGIDELVRRLEAHLFFEENDTFHAAHQLLAPSDWDEIDRDVAALDVP